MKAIGILIIGHLAETAAFIFRGWVFIRLWLWFIAATFSMPTIGLAQSCGMVGIISFLTHQKTCSYGDGKDPMERLAAEIVTSFMNPAMALMVGWIIKNFL